MKPAKPFTVEIKRNGRRKSVGVPHPIWDTEVLRKATEAVVESDKANGESRPDQPQ